MVDIQDQLGSNHISKEQCFYCCLNFLVAILFLFCALFSYLPLQQLPVQSVPITKIVSLNPVHGEVYSIQHYVIKFVRDLRQVSGFLEVLRFHPLSKTDCQDITEILLKVVLNTINQTKLINNFSKCPISFLLNYIVEGYSLNVMLTHLDKDIRFHYKSRGHVHSFVA